MLDEVASVPTPPVQTGMSTMARNWVHECRADLTFAWHRSRRRFFSDALYACIAETQRCLAAVLSERSPRSFGLLARNLSLERAQRRRSC